MGPELELIAKKKWRKFKQTTHISKEVSSLPLLARWRPGTRLPRVKSGLSYIIAIAVTPVRLINLFKDLIPHI